ncbi:unnamed protein product [Ascophyllum nodosum]
MRGQRLFPSVFLAVMSSSYLLRPLAISTQAFVPNTFRSLATTSAGRSARATTMPTPTCRPCSKRTRRGPGPREESFGLSFSSLPLSFSFAGRHLSSSSTCRQPIPGEGGPTSSSSTFQTSSPRSQSVPAETGAPISGGAGQGFGVDSGSRAADPDTSNPAPQRRQSQPERRPKKQQQKQQPKAPPRGNNLLVVGLGNPGKQYKFTRHNAGFLVAEELARRHGGTLKIRTAFQGEYCSISFRGKSVGILLPITFMNNSGMSARKVVDFFKLPINAALILVDEVALDFGQLRLKEKGSPGGHNGLKSIQAHLKTPDYSRLRIGIGGEDHACGAGPLSDHVLGEFTRSEKKELDSIVAEACDAVECWIEEDDMAKVMTRFNSR